MSQKQLCSIFFFKINYISLSNQKLGNYLDLLQICKENHYVFSPFHEDIKKYTYLNFNSYIYNQIQLKTDYQSVSRSVFLHKTVIKNYRRLYKQRLYRYFYDLIIVYRLTKNIDRNWIIGFNLLIEINIGRVNDKFQRQNQIQNKTSYLQVKIELFNSQLNISINKFPFDTLAPKTYLQTNKIISKISIIKFNWWHYSFSPLQYSEQKAIVKLTDKQKVMNTSFKIQQIKDLSIMGNQMHRAIIFFIMVLAWAIYYRIIDVVFKFKSLSKKNQYDTKNRIVSMTHGLITFVWSACLYLPYPIYRYIKDNFSQPNTQQETMIVMFSLAYSVYDLLACIYYGLADTGLYIHHLACAVGFGTGVFTGYGAIDGIGGLFVAESSNFPMHLRCILRNYNLKYTKGYEVSENLYLFIYIFFRGVLGPFILLYPSVTSTSPLPVRIVCCLLIAQSFYYIWNMIGIIQKKIKNNKEMAQKQIQYKWFEESQQLQKLSFYKKPHQGPKIF